MAEQNGTLDSAASAMEGYLDRDDNPGTETSQTGQATEAVREQAQAPEAEAETQGQETPQDTPADAPEQEADDGEDAAPQAVAPDDLLYTVKIDGKEQQVPVKELAGGYLRQSDYTRKTQEVAEIRRHAEGNLQQATLAAQQYVQLAGVLQQHLQQTMPQPPDQTLLDGDPLLYLKQKETYDHHVQRLIGAQQEMARARQFQEQHATAQRTQHVVENQRLLRERIPEWSDDKKWDEDRKEIANYLINQSGYTPEEVQNATDPRAIINARKAMLYDRVMARQGQLKPVQARSPRPIQAGSTQVNAPQTKARKTLQRLAQSGKTEDAAQAFLDSGII